MWGADELISVDFANQARALNSGLNVVWKIHILLQVDCGLRQGKIIVNAILEHDAHEGKTVERSRSDHVDARGGGEANLDWNSVVSLHLLRRETSRLSGDLQDHRRWIWIGLDIEPRKGEDASTDKQDQGEHEDRTPSQSER